MLPLNPSSLINPPTPPPSRPRPPLLLHPLLLILFLSLPLFALYLLPLPPFPPSSSSPSSSSSSPPTSPYSFSSSFPLYLLLPLPPFPPSSSSSSPHLTPSIGIQTGHGFDLPPDLLHLSDGQHLAVGGAGAGPVLRFVPPGARAHALHLEKRAQDYLPHLHHCHSL